MESLNYLKEIILCFKTLSNDAVSPISLKIMMLASWLSLNIGPNKLK